MAVTCPWCYENLELWVDADSVGAMVQDCDVCCRPWQLHISRDAETGAPRVDVTRA